MKKFDWWIAPTKWKVNTRKAEEGMVVSNHMSTWSYVDVASSGSKDGNAASYRGGRKKRINDSTAALSTKVRVWLQANLMRKRSLPKLTALALWFSPFLDLKRGVDGAKARSVAGRLVTRCAEGRLAAIGRARGGICGSIVDIAYKRNDWFEITQIDSTLPFLLWSCIILLGIKCSNWKFWDCSVFELVLLVSIYFSGALWFWKDSLSVNNIIEAKQHKSCLQVLITFLF